MAQDNLSWFKERAGIGKSRLLADLIERARSNDCNALSKIARSAVDAADDRAFDARGKG